MNDAELGALFDLEEEGPARPLDPSEADALVAGAMANFGAAPPPSGGAAGILTVVVVVALVGVAGLGALALTAGREMGDDAPASVADPVDVPATATEPEPEPEALPETAPSVTPEEDPPTKVRPRRQRAAPVAARDLLAEANALRAQRDWAAAEARYLEVRRQHPRSPEARVAAVAAADIRLEHRSDPRGAAVLYRRALRGALAAEAHFGLARAYRALGDRREADALRDLVERYPRSPLTAAGRSRLRELGE